MKTIIVSILVAIVLFGGALVAWQQAEAATGLADAHLRLATLRHVHTDAVSASENQGAAPSRWRIRPWQDDEQRHRATVSYWLARYDELKPWLEATGPQEVRDASLLFAAANAAFRDSRYEEGDRKAAVERLDGVIQAYANLLRLDPGMSDAAYNYEYVSRLRDALARNRPRPKPAQEVIDSPDLPTGPTVHGHPGAPPVGVKGDEFKTITPMRFDEREETTPGPGKKQQRKG
jgi:hypothetical protein